MKTTVLVQCIKMCGGGNSFNVYWPIPHKSNHSYRIVNEGKDYLPTIEVLKGNDATYQAFEPSFERYERVLKLEKIANRLDGKIIFKAFGLNLRNKPSLWITLPVDMETQSVKVKISWKRENFSKVVS